MVLIIETSYVTVTPKPTPIPMLTALSTLKTLPLMTASIPHRSTPILTPTLSPPPTTNATNAPLPLAFNPPLNPPSKSNNTIMIILLLSLVVVLAILICSLIGYVIYSRCIGQCLNCKDLAAQLGKWERGELKSITKEMVRRREAMNSEFEEVDLESGGAGENQPGSRGVHEETLEKLEGRKKMPLWRKFVQSTRGNMAAPEMEEEPKPTQSSRVASDRFFVVVNSPSVGDTITPPHISDSQQNFDNSTYPHSLYRPGSSIYSQPTVINQNPWSFKEYPIAEMPSMDSVSHADHAIQQETHPALSAGSDLAEPHRPENLEETGEYGDENISTVSLYKHPDRRLNKKRFSDRGRGKSGG